jgi:hypothetical protein
MSEHYRGSEVSAEAWPVREKLEPKNSFFFPHISTCFFGWRPFVRSVRDPLGDGWSEDEWAGLATGPESPPALEYPSPTPVQCFRFNPLASQQFFPELGRSNEGSGRYAH